MKKMMWFVVLVTASLSLQGAAAITLFDAAPTADAVIDSTGLTVSDSILSVQGYHSGIGSFGSIQRSYLMFDISSIPDNAQIISAVFGICVADINPGGYYTSDPSTGVFYVDDDTWSENTIDWDNAPASSYGGDFQATVDSQYYEWDILNGIDFQWDSLPDLSDNMVSLMLMSEYEGINNWARFYSSEAQDNNPYLKIEYSVPCVPEPTTMTLVIMGLLSTAAVRRLKKL